MRVDHGSYFVTMYMKTETIQENKKRKINKNEQKENDRN